MSHQTTIRFLSFLAIIALLSSAGCTSPPPPAETPPLPVLHHGEIAINLSEIEVRDPELFTANLTSTITTVLQDSRAALLLEHGWKIVSTWQEFDEEILDRPYVCVEMMKNGLSFYFLVDEEDERIFRGYCGATRWNASAAPRPEDYYRAHDTKTGLENVVDIRDQKDLVTVMIYGDSKIHYLNPAF